MRKDLSENSKQRPRLAIIGVGRWGKKLVEEFSNHADIVAFASNGNAKNIDWMKEHYPDAKQVSPIHLFSDKIDYDGLIVATNRNFLGEYALKGANHGKHVFVEKGCFFRLSSAAENACTAHDKSFFIGYKFMYGKEFEHMRVLSHAGSGNADYLNFEWYKFGTFDSSIVWNLACHDIAMAIHAFGDPIDCEVVQISNHKCYIRMLFKDEKYATFDIDRMTKNKREQRHIVEIGVVNQGHHRVVNFNASNPLPDECAAFIRCMEGEGVPMVGAKFATRVRNVLIKIMETK